MNRTDNTRRIFRQPKWHTDAIFADPRNPRNIWPQSVVKAPDGGYMLTYLGIPDPGLPIGDEYLSVFLAWSAGGIHFEPYDRIHPGETLPNMIGKMHEEIGMFPYLDEQEADPELRYKSVHARYGYDDGGKLVEMPAYLLGSPDLTYWKRFNDAAVTPSYVDCYPSLLRNPLTGRYQVTTRRR